MYDAKDTFQMAISAKNENAFKPATPLDSKYSLLLSLRMKDMNNRVVQFFDLFKHCHLTNTGALDMDDGIKIEKISTANGEGLNRVRMPRYGIYIRNNLPMWIVEIILEVKMTFAYMFTEYDNVSIAQVLTEDQVKAWESATETYKFLLSDDFILACIDVDNLKATLKTFDSTWEVDSDKPFIIFKVVKIDREENFIVIAPQEHLARLLPIQYKMSIKNFTDEVVNQHIDLYAVEIS